MGEGRTLPARLRLVPMHVGIRSIGPAKDAAYALRALRAAAQGALSQFYKGDELKAAYNAVIRVEVVHRATNQSAQSTEWPELEVEPTLTASSPLLPNVMCPAALDEAAKTPALHMWRCTERWTIALMLSRLRVCCRR